MQYAIVVYETKEEMLKRNDPEQAPAYWASYMAYSKALTEAGVMRGGAGLELPENATTVRVRESKRQIQDGPFADTVERLGGFFLIEVETLDEALEWASKCPAASSGALEVRPTLSPQ